MEWVMIWIIGMLVTGALADARGRHGGLWALAALFFTPLLALVVLALPSRKADKERRAAERNRSREHRICPSCAEMVRREALTCRHCGAAMPPAPPIRRWWSLG